MLILVSVILRTTHQFKLCYAIANIPESNVTDCYDTQYTYVYSAWGEGTFLAIQTAIIAALVLHYGGGSGKAALFLATYVGIVSALVSGVTPMDVLWTMQAVNVPIIVLAKVNIYS